MQLNGSVQTQFGGKLWPTYAINLNGSNAVLGLARTCLLLRRQTFFFLSRTKMCSGTLEIFNRASNYYIEEKERARDRQQWCVHKVTALNEQKKMMSIEHAREIKTFIHLYKLLTSFLTSIFAAHRYRYLWMCLLSEKREFDLPMNNYSIRLRLQNSIVRFLFLLCTPNVNRKISWGRRACTKTLNQKRVANLRDRSTHWHEMNKTKNNECIRWLCMCQVAATDFNLIERE